MVFMNSLNMRHETIYALCLGLSTQFRRRELIGKRPVSDVVVHVGPGQGSGQQLARNNGRGIIQVAVELEIRHDETDTTLFWWRIKKEAAWDQTRE